MSTMSEDAENFYAITLANAAALEAMYATLREATDDELEYVEVRDMIHDLRRRGEQHLAFQAPAKGKGKEGSGSTYLNRMEGHGLKAPGNKGNDGKGKGTTKGKDDNGNSGGSTNSRQRSRSR